MITRDVIAAAAATVTVQHLGHSVGVIRRLIVVQACASSARVIYPHRCALTASVLQIDDDDDDAFYI